MVVEIQVEEEIALQKFAKQVADLNKDEDTLLRFLRARDLNIEKAEQMLRKSLQWSEDNQVKSYRTWIPPKALAEDYHIQYIGNDNEGFPVIYFPLGSWNVRDRLQDGYVDETSKYMFYLYEAIFMATIEKSVRKQLVVIVDMIDLTFYKVAHMQTMNMVINGCQGFDANYPEILKAVYAINTAWVFPYAFSMVKPWIAPKTLSKLHVFDTNKSKWINAIQETMSLDILPQEILK